MTQIRVRRGTAAQWAASNPVLADGEPGWDTTNDVYKMGDGTLTWSALPELGGGTGSVAWADVTGKPTEFAPSAHVHDADDVNSGTLAVARIGTGTPAAGKYVDGAAGVWTALPEAPTIETVVVDLYRSANQSITHQSITEVLWTAENEDLDGFHDLVSNTGRMTVPTGGDGVYLINATLGYAANATGLRSVVIRVNGSDVVNVAEAAMSGGTETIVQGTVSVRLAATDYVTVHAYQDSGGSLDLVATRSSVVMASMGGAGGGTGSGLPAGIGSPDDYTAVDGAVINAGTSTTGFFQNGAGSIGTTTLNSVACVYTQIQTYEGANAGLNITSESTTGKEFVLVDWAWSPQNGMSGSPADVMHLMIADGQSLAGTRSTVFIPRIPASVWATMVIPVGTLADVESIGVLCDIGNYATGGQACRVHWSNIRWANQTEADQALQEGAVLISPTYSPGITQEVNAPLADKTRVNLDPDVAWIDGFGGVRNIREWGVPEDGLTECSARIAQALNGLSYGQTLVFPSKGLYWVDYPLRVRSGTRIEFNGATLFTRVWRGGDNNQQDPMIEVNGKDITLVGPHLVGYREPVVNGSTFSTVAGTPTNSGNDKLLDAQGESVHYLTGNAHVPWYARYPLVQFPSAYRTMIATAYPTFRFGNAWVFTLSDSAQVASDCVLEAVDPYTGVVYATRTLTLTGTPTEYVLAWEPTDLEAQPSVRVRKATATANTITLASGRLFGYTEYNINHDSANAIVVQNAQNCLIEDFLIEGAPTDAIDSTSTANKNNTFRNGVSRACSRQGVSANLGSAAFENVLIIGANRSGVDIEPYGLDWLVDRLVLRDLRIIGCENWAIAMANWAGITNITIDGIVTERCLVGGLIGGGRGGTITNFTTDGAFYVKGQKLRGGNITCGTFAISGETAVYAPAGTGLGQTTAGASNSNTAALNSVAGLSVGQRVRLANVSPTTTDPLRKITAINALNVTFDGDPVSWSAFYTIFYDPSVAYESRENTFTGVTIISASAPNVSGVTNKVVDVRGITGINVNQNIAVWEISEGYLGVHDTVRDVFTKQFGRSFAADRGTEPPFIYGGMDLRGQALLGLKGLSGDRRVTAASVADVTAGGGRGVSSAIDLGFRGLNVQLHLTPWVSTGARLTVTVEVSQNNSNWYTIATFPDITDSGQHYSMPIRFCERYVRGRYFFSGTGSPSGSFGLTATYGLPTNNTSGTWTGASTTTPTVTFPSKGGPEFNITDVSPNAAAGSLSQSTTYYYRIGARTREAGPYVWKAEDSVALGAGQTSVTLYFERWLAQTIGYWTDGMSVLRGTVAGTYTTRFDIMAKSGVELFTHRSDGSSFIDMGTHVAVSSALHWPDFPDTYPTLSPKLTATDESGAEVDNTYRVFTMPAYTAITKRTDGFDVTFASALTAFDWFVVR